ncbi:MAG: Zn-dependent alcohol dehydrogenase [Deltaproteobacteria bacterium]|nr:Zn-dependent alcohol dehydrogenase [Deltaproteobacteria bacterium]
MKAAVLYELNKPLVVEELEIDHPKKNQVKIRLGATSICHSDLHCISGDFVEPLPCVLGHESAGYIEEVGENVTYVKPGDKVIVSTIRSCRQCVYCLTGHPSLCTGHFPMDHEAHMRNKKGEPVFNGIEVAGFGEYTIIDESAVVPIPSDMPIDRAALLGCGAMAGFFGVVHKNIPIPSSVVIIGCGGVGLNSIQGAAFSGAHPIIAIDFLERKLEAAQNFGATHTINAKNTDPVEAVKDLTSGNGVDWVFVAVSKPSAIVDALHMTNRLGTVVIIGMPSKEDKYFSVDVHDMVFIKQRTITSSFMGGVRPRIDLPFLVELYKAGKFKLDELISGRYPLDQINEAIESVYRGEALRNVIVF